MKYTLAILTILVSLSLANFHNLQHRTGSDILHKLKAGNHDIYLMVFYQPDGGHDHLKSANRHLIEKVENDFLHKNDIKDLYYATIDATNPTYKQLVDELTIDAEDLVNAPQLFIMEHGNGFVMTGPRALGEMEQNLNELLNNRDQGF